VAAANGWLKDHFRSEHNRQLTKKLTVDELRKHDAFTRWQQDRHPEPVQLGFGGV
jgi:hypothetical protein